MASFSLSKSTDGTSLTSFLIPEDDLHHTSSKRGPAKSVDVIRSTLILFYTTWSSRASLSLPFLCQEAFQWGLVWMPSGPGQLHQLVQHGHAAAHLFEVSTFLYLTVSDRTVSDHSFISFSLNLLPSTQTKHPIRYLPRDLLFPPVSLPPLLLQFRCFMPLLVIYLITWKEL